MTWKFRKNVNCGLGFKIDISKSGVGYNWGAPNYKFTHKPNNVPLPRANSMERYNLEYSTSHKVINGKIKDISSLENKTLVKAIKKIKIRNFVTWCIFGLIVALSSMFLQLYIEWLGMLLFFGISLLTLFLAIFLNHRRFILLDYTIDKETEEYINKRNAAFKCLALSSNLWLITDYQNVIYSRVNAGCQTNIRRKNINFQCQKLPNCIRTNQDAMFYQLIIGSTKYIFLPDKIIILGLLNVAVLSYCDIKISLEKTNFAETETPPIDALFLYNTWLYVNNNGTPDRRFNNNKQIPVYRYMKIFIESYSGLNLHLMSSSEEKAEEFKRLYDALD